VPIEEEEKMTCKTYEQQDQKIMLYYRTTERRFWKTLEETIKQAETLKA
jgi:hypothetical protein